MDNEFPPNSHSNKETRPSREQLARSPEKKEVTRVTRTKATLRKKPLYKQFFEAFRPEDNRGFVEYAVMEVLVPGIKDSIADSAGAGVEHLFGGGPRSRSRRRRGGGGGYTSYSGMSDSRPRSRREREEERRPSRRDTRGSVDHLEIVLDTRVEAEEVIDALYELISKYEVATRRDLLSLVGEPHSFTDEDWGWTELRGARVHRAGRGYLLDLPRPEPLD